MVLKHAIQENRQVKQPVQQPFILYKTVPKETSGMSGAVELTYRSSETI